MRLITTDSRDDKYLHHLSHDLRVRHSHTTSPSPSPIALSHLTLHLRRSHMTSPAREREASLELLTCMIWLIMAGLDIICCII